MGKRTVIPFGPQHPVLPEPLQINLVLEDEKVVEAIPSIGFIHRGLEKLVEKKTFTEMVYVAERICGICSFIHGMTYCMAVEEIMKIQVPPRAEYLRVFWAELSRIHSHLLWLGLMADSMGFESLFMHTWRVRDKILNIIEETTGGRVIFGTCKVGGVRRNITNDRFPGLLKELEKQGRQIREIGAIFLNDSSVKHRLKGTGILSKEQAYDLGAVGPTVRGSGVVTDTRTLGYSIYDNLEFEPRTETDGDSYARCKVRVREVAQSLDLIRQVTAKMPDGDIEAKYQGVPSGESFTRTEQPRGEVLYYLKGNGSANLQRLRVRTPTFANVPALVTMLAGCQLADVPVLILTIDPCISCMER